MRAPRGVRQLTDEDLIRRAAELDAASLGELYERHAGAAYALARRIVGPARAEDAVQEAFVSLWRSASRYDAARGPVGRWLLAIVRFSSIDQLRRVAAQQRFDDVDRALGDLAAPNEHAVRSAGATKVGDALAALPVEQRRVIELAYFGGLTQGEIADRLGVPLGTVKGRTRRALEELRSALEAELHEPG